MKQLKKSQSGFSAVELLLALLIIAVVAFGGFYVWHSNKKDTTDSNNKNSTSNSSTSSSSKTDNTAYLEISKYHSRLPLTSELSSLKLGELEPGQLGLIGETVQVLAPELDANYTCTVAEGTTAQANLGSVTISKEKYDGTGQYKPTATTKVGDYYYAFFPSFGCYEGQSLTKFDNLKSAFSSQFSKLESF
jgi:prepilin-type N-terminal cleavage/methylation domain-containing protein